MFFSTLVLVIIALGLYFRHQPKRHIPLMITAFLADTSLVLVIELQRKAVESVIENATHEPSLFVLFHAVISLIIIILYVSLTIVGMRIIRKSKRDLLPLHKKLAVVFIVLRLINYITSFGMADNLS